MKSVNSITSRLVTGGVAALLALTSFRLAIRPALAHEADCPVCSLPVVQDTDKMDNEVKLRFGRKRIEYRCVYCAIAEAKNEFADGDVTISAPSEKKGAPVIIKREGGKWTASPASAVFVGVKVNHKHCQVGYRALTSAAALNTYKQQNKDVVGDAKPLSLTQMVALAK